MDRRTPRSSRTVTRFPYAMHSRSAVAMTALASGLACGAVLRLLVAGLVYDGPNRRSSHAVAKPRGAGLAIVPVVLFAWIAAALAAGRADAGFWAIVADRKSTRLNSSH